MKRIHTLFIALILGAAAAAGLLAATRTVDLGRAAPAQPVSNATIVARATKIDRLERSLDRALASRPPRLPKVPKAAEVNSAMSQPSQSNGSGGVVYVHSQSTTASPSYEEDDEYSDDAGELEYEGGDD